MTVGNVESPFSRGQVSNRKYQMTKGNKKGMNVSDAFALIA